LKILIADDHFAVREGLKTILNAAKALAPCEVLEAVSVAQARTWLGVPDLVLLDIQFPDGSGLELAREFTSGVVKTPVVMLSMYQEGRFVFQALQAGVLGFVSKESAGTVLVEAIVAVLVGHTYLDQACLDHLATTIRNVSAEMMDNVSALSALSSREKEVFYGLLGGENTKVIASRLALSSKTIDNHRANLFAKLGLDGLPALLQFARGNKLL
jgi:DNA-binding NarL/FixJ family response regulator